MSYHIGVNYRDRISINPSIRSGKPIVNGTRITVFDVLDYLSSGTSEAELLTEFPQLSHEDVLACLGYAADRERRVTTIQP